MTSAQGADTRSQTLRVLTVSSGGAVDTAPFLREFPRRLGPTSLLLLLLFGPCTLSADYRLRAATAIDKDHEFDHGSNITLTNLTPLQTENLALLGKVWGFLKYHHRAITSGARQWDYDLLRILPTIVTAPDQTTAITALTNWIDGLGNVPPCAPCIKLNEADIQTRPDIHWIFEQAVLGTPLASRLQNIHRNRNGKQFYVSLSEDAGNPSFNHELQYNTLTYPDPGFQILALFRYWNAIEYWYPNREVINEDWDAVLREFLPKIALAPDVTQYQLALMALIARVHDSHANLSSLAKRPPVGPCEVPAAVRFVEGSFVVTSSGASGLERGDVIVKLDGIPVPKLIDDWKPYYGASNDASLMRDLAASLTHGDCSPLKIDVRRNSQEITVKPQRVSSRKFVYPTHDLPGPVFRLLSPDVAYLKLSAVKSADAARYVRQAAHTKGLIIDIRNYPSEFMVWSLGPLLMNKKTPFSFITNGDLSTPGAFHWINQEVLPAKQPHYNGKVVILIDEDSQSQSEYTTMAFRAAPGAVVVGGSTAGADGNVSTIPLPGGFTTMISGIGIFYPDKRPTQRAGIVADVPAQPTIAGIHAGRDEVLEVGLRQIVSADQAAAITERLRQENTR